jgi:hypothetical protein
MTSSESRPIRLPVVDHSLQLIKLIDVIGQERVQRDGLVLTDV